MYYPHRIGAWSAVTVVVCGLLTFGAPSAHAAPAPAPTPSPTTSPTPGATAAPAEPDAVCALSGHLPASGEEARRVRAELRGKTANDMAGVRLERASTWTMPRGREPVLVVDSTRRLTSGEAVAVLFGIEFPIRSGSGDAGERYVTSTTMPHLGPTVRTIGVHAESNACAGSLVLSVDRGILTTRLGVAGIAASTVFGVLLVLLARGRRGGWTRRFLLAALPGLLAGAGEAAVLQEAGLVSPFSRWSWLAPVVGLALAAVLPLTRRRTTPKPAVQQAPPAAPAVPGYAIDGHFGRTPAGDVFRGIHAETGDRVLLTVLRPELAAVPWAAERVRRAATTLARLDDDHCPRLRAVLAGEPAPVIVTGYVDGVTARRVLDERGALSGPQACAVLAGVLGGLSAVHRLGLVHRDVRPENVLLDADGRVLLSGFELAAPGADNAGSPEGEPPYAGPQQRRGEAIDGRADLWACGAVLGELLTGRPPVVDEATGELLLGGTTPDGTAQLVPEPVVSFLARALATDPAPRPASAEEMLAELSTVAAEAYGPDWMRLGALTGALVLPGGVVVASAVAGAAVPAVAVSGGATAAVPAGGTAITATAGFGSKVTAFATPAIALATAAVVVLTAIAANAAPANTSDLITPEAARVIFVRTIGEFRAGDRRHAPDIDGRVRSFVELAFPDPGPQLANIRVGVPRGQRSYPARFVAYATVTHPDGSVFTLLLRFVRAGGDNPWLVVRFQMWQDTDIPPPLLDDDGYLVPVPTGDLIVDPASLPQRWLDWADRAARNDAVGTDPVLEAPGSGFLASQARDRFRGDRSRASFQYRYGPGQLTGEPIPMSNGTVLVDFTVTVQQTVYNRPGFRTGPCTHYVWTDFRSGRFRRYTNRLDVSVTAWVPMRDKLAAPAATPNPTPSPTASPSPPPAPTPLPFKQDKVYVTEDTGGQNLSVIPC